MNVFECIIHRVESKRLNRNEGNELKLERCTLATMTSCSIFAFLLIAKALRDKKKNRLQCDGLEMTMIFVILAHTSDNFEGSFLLQFTAILINLSYENAQIILSRYRERKKKMISTWNNTRFSRNLSFFVWNEMEI